MPRFTAVPSLPPAGLEPAQYQLLAAMKENVELLTGTRGELDGASRAITRDAVSVPAATAQFTSLSARGSGYTVNGVQLVSLSDYQNLLRDVQNLAADVNTLRTALNALLQQLGR